MFHYPRPGLAPAALCLTFSISGISATLAQDIERFLPNAKAQCVGDLPKRHQGDLPWDFTTNSRLPTTEEPTVFLHCIFNNDPKNVLDVDWLIPRLKQPIPGSMSALSPRYSAKPPLGNPDGCLIFGNLLNKASKAQFWARQEDKDNVTAEDGKDCLTLRQMDARAERGKLEKKADTVAPFRMFLRSIPDSQTSALVAFEGITGLRMKDARVYESYVTYQIRNEKGEPPSDFGAYALAPRLVGPAELLAKSFISQIKAPVSLLSRKEPTTVAFFVEGTGEWDFQELEYTVFDKSGKVAGSFFSPVFIPLPAR